MKKSETEAVSAKQNPPQPANIYAHAYQLEPGDVLHVSGFPVEYVGGGLVGTNTLLPEERDKED